MSHFRNLPPEVVSVLLSHLSRRPRAAGWQSSVSAADVLTLLRCDGPLASVARADFSSVSLPAARASSRASPAAVVASSASDVHALAERLGPSLLRLTLCASSHPSLDAPLLARHCVRLRSLTLSSRFGDFDLHCLLPSAGGSLTSLHLSGYILPRTHSSAIALHCTALESLSLHFALVGEPLDRLWASVGQRLRSLSLRGELFARGMYPAGGRADAIGEVGRRCGRVETLTLEAFGGEDAVRLAGIMAASLRSVRFLERGSCPPPADIAALLAKCPQVAVDAFVETDVAASLEALGGAARSLHLRAAAAEGLADASEKLNGLEEMHVHAEPGYECEMPAFLDALLGSPKRQLRVLSLAQGRCTEAALDVLARRVETVKEFRCSVGRIPVEAMKRFARSNTRLQKVVVERSRENCAVGGGMQVQEAEVMASKLVEAFAGCEALEELEVKDAVMEKWSKDVQAAARKLGNRTLRLYVGSHAYL